MFKNKRIVALALFAVMLLVPFASAFALADPADHTAWPKLNWLTGNTAVDHITNGEAPADRLPLSAEELVDGTNGTNYPGVNQYVPVFNLITNNLPAGGGAATYTYWAKEYAGTGDLAAWNANKTRILDNLKLAKEYEKALRFRVNMAEKYSDAQFSHANSQEATLPAPGSIWDLVTGPGTSYGWGDGKNAAAFAIARAKVKGSLATLSNAIKDLEDAIKNATPYIAFGDAKFIIDGNIVDSGVILSHLTSLSALWDTWDAEQKAQASAQLKKIFDIFKKVADPAKVEQFLAGISDDLKKVLVAEAPKSLTKDGWKVEEVESAPGALNGADELRIEKNAKGNYVAKLYKAGVEIPSKGLVWVYQPTNGVKAKKIKVDGVETTFSVVNGCWKYAAEFKVK